MPNYIDLTGLKVGRLTVIEIAEQFGLHKKWWCLCECGGRVAVRGDVLRNGETKSCGCIVREICIARTITNPPARTHGMRHSRTYNSWASMRARCNRPNSINYARYGGRGISVCARWLHSFENFLRDMGIRPEGKTLDRIDNNGNYEPSNCRWATLKEQRHNRRPMSPKRMRTVS